MDRRYPAAPLTSVLSQHIRPLEVALETPSGISATEISDPLIVRAMVLIQNKHTLTIDYAKLASDLAVSQRTLS